MIHGISDIHLLLVEILPKMIGIGQMDKFEDIKTGKTDKLQSNLTPGVLASFMIH